MNGDKEEGGETRSPVDVVEFYIICLGFMTAVGAIVVTSSDWAIRGLILMAIGLVYFLIKADDPETG
jgi:hypothetical protein